MPVPLPLEATTEQGHEKKSLKISASDYSFFSNGAFFQMLLQSIAHTDLSNVS